MKKFIVLVLMCMVVAVMAAAPPVLAQMHLNPASVATDAATGPVALAGVAELRSQLDAATVALAAAQADILVAKRLGGAALDRAKAIEAAHAAKVAELEANISSEVAKAKAEVDKAAVDATVKIVAIQHGVPAPAPASDAVAAATAPTPATTATGLERLACSAGTTYRKITVVDGALRSGYREECLPIPGYTSPDAPKVGASVGGYLVACGIGAVPGALVALAVPGVSDFSSETEVGAGDYAVAAGVGAGVGCLGGILFTALGD